MSWVAAGVASATATYQIGSSIYKKRQAKKMMEGNEYEIPMEAKQNLSDAQRQSLEGLPAEQQRQYLENIQQAQAVSIDAMQDRRGGLVGAAGVQASATEGYKQLLAMESQARVQNQQQLMQQRDVMAGYKDLEWKTNVFDPATEMRKQGDANLGAGIQNAAAAATYAGQGMSSGGVTSPQARQSQDTTQPEESYDIIKTLNQDDPMVGATSDLYTGQGSNLPSDPGYNWNSPGVSNPGVYGGFQF